MTDCEDILTKSNTELQQCLENKNKLEEEKLVMQESFAQEIAKLKDELDKRNAELAEKNAEIEQVPLLLQVSENQFSDVNRILETVRVEMAKNEAEFNNRIKIEIEKQHELAIQLDNVNNTTTQNAYQLQDAVNTLSLDSEKIKEENNKLEKELNDKILENLLMTIPSNQELLRLNKEYNGYGIILKGFLDINSDGETTKKFQIEWKRISLRLIKRNDIIQNLKIENGILSFLNKAGEEIKLNFDRQSKFDFDDISEGYQNLKQSAKRKKNITTLEKLQDFCILKKNTHDKASKRFASKNLWFILPSILITALSGIFSFLASSTETDANTSIWLSIVVGILASISTFLQSFSGAMDFGGKTEGHSSATEEYDNILTVINFEINNPKESLENPYDFYNKIKKEILQIKQKCKYQVPQDINKKYSVDKINFQLQKIKDDLMKDALELKADIVRNTIEGKTSYQDININQIEKEFEFSSLFAKNTLNNKSCCSSPECCCGTDEVV